MGKIKFLLFGIIFTLVSCNEFIVESISPETEKKSETFKPYYRDYDEALETAKEHIFGSSTRSKSVPEVKNHYVYKPSPLTRNVSDTVDVAFHVINFENEQGFAIISADKRAVPVYAYSGEGNINLYDAVEESGWGYFMDMAEKHYTSTLALDLPPFINPQDSAIGGPNYGDIPQLAIDYLNGVRCRVRTTDTYYNYGTRLFTLWDQYSPYNYYFPYVENALTLCNGKSSAGCAPVSIGQIMAFHEFPLSYQGFTFNWELIKSKQGYSQDELIDASLNTAQLLRCIAHLGDADFNVLTGMDIRGMIGAFQAMGYHATVTSFTSEILKNDFMTHNNPVIIGGERPTDNFKHVWIVDEYRKKHTTLTYYYDEPPYNIYETFDSDTHYFHCNWGSGAGNPSAYCLNVFESPEGWTYSNSQIIIYNISPNNQ